VIYLVHLIVIQRDGMNFDKQFQSLLILLLCRLFLFLYWIIYIVFIYSRFDPDGVGKLKNKILMIILFSVLDIFFLNREPMRNVKNAEELIPVFAVPPSGK
jgi:bacteriorhodopsin